MNLLTHDELIALLLALGLLLFSARLLGEVAKRFNQPSVLGEIAAGILLGPTVLGALAPDVSLFLFPPQGGGAVALQTLTTLAIILFLLVAGIEVDLSTVWRQGKAAVCVALVGMMLPFSIGFSLAWWSPSLLGYQPGTHHLGFALFMATALSISALPIIAKILMDLNLYRSDLGVTIVAAAVLNDLLGWLIFAVVLGIVGGHGAALPIGHTLWLTLAFTAAMLTVVPWLIHRALPWIQAYTSWPAGVLAFALSLCLFAAAFTEWLGVHAIFGSFLAGVAVGHSSHLRERTRMTIDQFVSFIFAPLFFASIGLKVDFASHFDLGLTAVVLTVAFPGKAIGSALGGRLGGLPWREAWGAGFGMSAQGTMGIILGVLALQSGLIGQEIFVSIVVMSLLTSMVSGPMLQKILRLRKPRRFYDHLAPAAFLARLEATDRPTAIAEMATVLAATAGLRPEMVTDAVLARERIMATGLGEGVAVPHARLPDLTEPFVAVGLSATGVDFDAPDGLPAKLIFLVLTPQHDNGAQLEILADIARTFHDERLREKSLNIENHTQFLALIKTRPGR